jgi:molybdopterin converting factor small subunit
MNRVSIELWLGLSKGDEGDFESPSEMRSIREEEVEEGTTILQLLDRLARTKSSFAGKVFDLKAKSLYPHLVISYNDRVISPYEVYDRILKNGDKITILPMHPGG